MAIHGVFGLPGSGKSSFLAFLAARALSGKPLTLGRFAWKYSLSETSHFDRVYTNFDCPGCFRLNFDDLGLVDFSNCLILIDEIMLLCDSRDYKNFPHHLRDFLALHRHYGVTICYCSQGYADTDKRIRNLTDNLFYIEKSGSFSKISPIKKSWRIDQDIAEGYTLCPPIASTWIYRPRYYKLFNSFDKPLKLAENNSKPWPNLSECKCGVLRQAFCAYRAVCPIKKYPA